MTPSENKPEKPADDPTAQAMPEGKPSSPGVTSEQTKTNGMEELKRLEAELSQKPAPGAKPAEPAAPGAAPAAEVEPKPRRRRFKRPPPENTIRMTIRQYWRFRVWLANRKLKLPAHLVGAVLEGTDQTLVEPLVEPIIGIMDEYVPEQWIEFIEEKSPLLTFLIALFEAEQTFGSRIDQLAHEIKQETPRTPAGAPASSVGIYPKKGEV